MKRLLITFFLFVPMLLFSQTESMVYRDSTVGDNHVFLNFSGGLGVGVFRDMGTYPFSYKGIEICPRMSVDVRRQMWRFETSIDICGGMYGNLGGGELLPAFGGQPSLKFQTIHKFADNGRLQFWAGGAIDELCDIRSNSSLGNANLALSSFTRLILSGRVEFVCNVHWLFFAQADLAPMAYAYRPGFSYISNFDQNPGNPVANVFDQFHGYVVGVPSVATQVGATLALANGNGLSLAYQWHHITSRTSDLCPHRFDQASHLFTFTLHFAI